MLIKKLNILIFILVLGVLPAKTFLAEKGLKNKNILLNNLSINERTESGYLRLSEENQQTTTDEGMPELPVYSTLYMVDPLKDYEFNLIIHDSYIIENAQVYPFQNETNNSFVKNESFYSGNQAYPEQNLSTSELMQARNMQLVSVSVTPFSYQPNTNTL